MLEKFAAKDNSTQGKLQNSSAKDAGPQETSGASYWLSVATSASPELAITITSISPAKRFHCAGDEVRGLVTLNAPFDCTHTGVKITLRGVIRNKSNDTFFGALKPGLIATGHSYEFI